MVAQMLPNKNSKEFRRALGKKIAHGHKSRSSTDVARQQCNEYPLALCTIEGLPVKGQ